MRLRRTSRARNRNRSRFHLSDVEKNELTIPGDVIRIVSFCELPVSLRTMQRGNPYLLRPPYADPGIGLFTLLNNF